MTKEDWDIMVPSDDHRRPNAWLWRLAILLLVGGSAASYFLYRQASDPAGRRAFSAAVALTVVGVGLCVIIATADWWIKK